PDVVRQLGGKLADVGAVVAVLGHGATRRERQDGATEGAHLGAAVVEVVLAGDAMTGALEDAAEQVADEGATGVPDVQWSRRVGRHELDVDVPRGRAPGTPEGRPGGPG